MSNNSVDTGTLGLSCGSMFLVKDRTQANYLKEGHCHSYAPRRQRRIFFCFNI